MNATDQLRATAYRSVEASRHTDELMAQLCQRFAGETDEQWSHRCAAFDNVRKASQCLDAAAMTLFLALAKPQPTERE